MSNNNSCCFAKILKVITTLQRSTNNDCNLALGCDKPFLGNITSSLGYNTRPITLYNKNGELFTAVYDTSGDTTSVFRVESVHGDSCKCRALAPTTTEGTTTYSSTNFFIEINLKCVCALKCLDDIILENV